MHTKEANVREEKKSILASLRRWLNSKSVKKEERGNRQHLHENKKRGGRFSGFPSPLIIMALMFDLTLVPMHLSAIHFCSICLH